MNIYKERLLKLAEHLRIGKLGHEKFSFSAFNSGSYDHNGCGTHGCAIGECPILFPEHWEFNRTNKNPVLRKSLCHRAGIGDVSEDTREFFGLTDQETEILFFPIEYLPDEWRREYMKFEESGVKLLNRCATKEEVAENIEKFVEWKYNLNK